MHSLTMLSLIVLKTITFSTVFQQASASDCDGWSYDAPGKFLQKEQINFNFEK